MAVPFLSVTASCGGDYSCISSDGAEPLLYDYCKHII